jgi:glucosamine-6-phosphate deaminase
MILMQKVFAIGDLNVDLHSQVSCKPVFGEEHFSKNFRITIGGNAANFACALGNLGADTRLISIIGKDLYTDFLKSELEKFNVKSMLLKSNNQNGISNIMVAKSGERAILSNKGCLLELDSKSVAKKLLPALSRGDIAYFGGFFHLSGMKKGFNDLLKKIRKKGGLVFFDATFDEHGKWEVKSFAKYVDLFFLNEVELKHIAKTNQENQALKKLAAMGFKKIVLKKGPKGSAIFSNGKKHYFPAFKGNSKDSTGAGDFFNAGFVFGLINGFSDLNCLRMGNYVAFRKISMKGFANTRSQDIWNFAESQNLIELEIAKNYEAMSNRIVEEISSDLNNKPDSVFCFASGKTPRLAYKKIGKLAKSKKMDFSKASFIQMDEYIGLKENETLLHDIEKNFLSKTNFNKQNVYLMNKGDYNAECKRFDSICNKLGIDLILLGIGENGHIAFNEPGTKFNVGTHLTKLSNQTLKANNVAFPKNQKWHAITIGPKQIMHSKKALLVASGEKKADAIYKVFFGKKTEKIPASLLQSHKNSRIIVDKKAAEKILNNIDKFKKTTLQANKTLLIRHLDLH